MMNLNAAEPRACGRTPDDREETSIGGFLLLVEIQIICATKGSVEGHDGGGDEERNQHIEPNVGEDESDDGDDGEQGQNDAVIDGTVEEDKGLVAEQIEEGPGDEDDEEDDHGDRVPQETEEEDEEDDERVVDTEVAEVALQAGGGFTECVRARE